MLTSALKEYTKEAHQSLEGRIVRKLKSVSCRGDYFEILKIFYGYYRAVEKNLRDFIDADVLPDIDERRKSGWLASDLSCMDPERSEAVGLCEDLPEVENLHQALGVMYVLEGSTLGGKVIQTMIRERIALDDDCLTFFGAYRENTISRWNLFRKTLDEMNVSAKDRDAILQSADDTFIKFKNWIDLHESGKEL